jgi:hypothetical protein
MEVTDPSRPRAVSNRASKNGNAQMNAFTWLRHGLHESRRRHAEREIRRYAHLIAASKVHDRRLEIAAAAREEDLSWRDAIAAVVGTGA